MKPYWPDPVSSHAASAAKDHADAIWLCAAASEAAKDGRFQDALRIVGDAAHTLGRLIVADVKRNGVR
jgi:hypothetical protein